MIQALSQEIRKFIKIFTYLLGYEIKIKKLKINDLLENEAYIAIKKIQPYTMLPSERLITLYKKVAFCEKYNIQGSLVECGVWKGGAVALMALANLKYGKERRHIHLFDAFSEICEPDEAVDGERATREVKRWLREGGSGNLIPLVGIYDSLGGPGQLEDNQNLLETIIGYSPKFLHYHKGWFQDTLPKDANDIGEIAILRLDSDWYASTKICLEYLYDKVVSGGFIIIDDYGTYDGCRKAVDEFIENKNIKAYLNDVDNSCKYWIKI